MAAAVAAAVAVAVAAAVAVAVAVAAVVAVAVAAVVASMFELLGLESTCSLEPLPWRQQHSQMCCLDSHFQTYSAAECFHQNLPDVVVSACFFVSFSNSFF